MAHQQPGSPPGLCDVALLPLSNPISHHSCPSFIPALLKQTQELRKERAAMYVPRRVSSGT